MTTALGVAILIFAGTIISLEAGFRWGRRDTAGNAAAHEGLGAVEASAFALVGLLLGFSFAGAMSRLDAKREAIVAEANAIGTAYRRIDILPAETQPAIRDEFKRLIDARINAYEQRFDAGAAGRHLEAFDAAEDRIWQLTVAATAASKESALLVLPPVNEMIDVSTARAVLLRAHLPVLILGLLIVAAVSSGLLAGYGMTKRRQRSWFHAIAYAALLAATVYTVLDLDQPRFGLINIETAYQPLTQLRDAMR
jgi:hypothetical protein